MLAVSQPSPHSLYVHYIYTAGLLIYQAIHNIAVIPPHRTHHSTPSSPSRSCMAFPILVFVLALALLQRLPWVLATSSAASTFSPVREPALSPCKHEWSCLYLHPVIWSPSLSTKRQTSWNQILRCFNCCAYKIMRMVFSGSSLLLGLQAVCAIVHSSNFASLFLTFVPGIDLSLHSLSLVLVRFYHILSFSYP